jgi:predicted transcriptional regulator
MSHTITVRLTDELARWLSSAARRARLPQGRIVREQLEKGRAAEKQGFMRLAGSIDKDADLSSRRGFSRK